MWKVCDLAIGVCSKSCIDGLSIVRMTVSFCTVRFDTHELGNIVALVLRHLLNKGIAGNIKQGLRSVGLAQSDASLDVVLSGVVAVIDKYISVSPGVDVPLQSSIPTEDDGVL